MIRCFALAAALALTACGNEEQPAAAPEDTPMASEVASPALPVPPPPPLPLPNADELSTIPAAFHGEWDLASAPCEPATDGRLTVSADRLQFYESMGQVMSVRLESPTRILVALQMRGEGEEWQTSYRFELRDGGRTLSGNTTGAEAATPLLRKRCA